MSNTPDLQAQLDEISARTRSLVPPDRLAATDRFIAELHATGIEDRILSPGAEAPAFDLPLAAATALSSLATANIPGVATGEDPALRTRHVRSSDLLAVGPLIVVFFRGRWDPYCMTTLEAWQRLYPALRRPSPTRPHGALLVAISPQLPRQNDFTVQQHHLTFPLLSDPGCTIATRFGLTYTLPQPMQDHLRSILINIPFINGDQSWRLPLPATFVLDPTGVITYAEAHADHRVRTDPAEILSSLAAQHA